ncbi:1191_t:CDS:2, partial [Funneliformis geosporum]
MTANGQYLGIEYNKEENQFELPYKLFINHAPGVLIITSFQILGTGVGINPTGIVLDSLRQENPIGNPVKDFQTDRMFKSTLFDPLNKSIEPSMFRSDTIDFHYSLNEFYTRLTEPLFFYRIHIRKKDKEKGTDTHTFEAEEHYREKEITETVETKKTDHAD